MEVLCMGIRYKSQLALLYKNMQIKIPVMKPNTKCQMTSVLNNFSSPTNASKSEHLPGASTKSFPKRHQRYVTHHNCTEVRSSKLLSSCLWWGVDSFSGVRALFITRTPVAWTDYLQNQISRIQTLGECSRCFSRDLDPEVKVIVYS